MAKQDEKVVQIIGSGNNLYGLTSEGAVVVLAEIGWTPFATSTIYMPKEGPSIQIEPSNKYHKHAKLADSIEIDDIIISNEVEGFVKSKKERVKKSQR